MTDLFDFARSSGSKVRDTSRAAASEIAPRAHLLRERCLDVFKRTGRGLTADEVADQLGESVLSIRPRITELARAQAIHDTEQRRPNASGRKAIVWKRFNRSDLADPSASPGTPAHDAGCNR